MASPDSTSSHAARRPLKSRRSRAIRGLAARMAARRIQPNAISLAGVVFSAAAAGALFGAAEVDDTAWRSVLLAAAVAGIQLRLLCNLLDGLVAVEGGLRAPDGELFNEVPDRVSDTLLLVAAGYAAGVPLLGWAAALAAALTAYVRLLGGALGQAQDFSGVMAKPQRMALLCAACPAAVVSLEAFAVALILVVLGCSVTCATRLAHLRRALRAS